MKKKHIKSNLKTSDAVWLDIRTAPKNGTEILAYERIAETGKLLNEGTWPARDNYTVAWWHVCKRNKEVPVGGGLFRKEEEIFFEGWINGWDYTIPQRCHPTHWMPMPPPPKL